LRANKIEEDISENFLNLLNFHLIIFPYPRKTHFGFDHESVSSYIKLINFSTAAVVKIFEIAAKTF
jgi:hypothetical protein